MIWWRSTEGTLSSRSGWILSARFSMYVLYCIWFTGGISTPWIWDVLCLVCVCYSKSRWVYVSLDSSTLSSGYRKKHKSIQYPHKDRNLNLFVCVCEHACVRACVCILPCWEVIQWTAITQGFLRSLCVRLNEETFSQTKWHDATKEWMLKKRADKKKVLSPSIHSHVKVLDSQTQGELSWVKFRRQQRQAQEWSGRKGYVSQVLLWHQVETHLCAKFFPLTLNNHIFKCRPCAFSHQF